MSAVYQAGDRCVFCGESTAAGSGRFVNRVPASTGADQAPWLPAELASAGADLEIAGYACSDCMAPAPGDECLCSACGDCDGTRTNHPDSDVPDLCSWCTDGHDDEDEGEDEEDPA